jgi:hypothetical protein
VFARDGGVATVDPCACVIVAFTWLFFRPPHLRGGSLRRGPRFANVCEGNDDLEVDYRA